MQNMDEMDSDVVLEVPDTPDRLTIRRRVDGSSKPSWDREDFRQGCKPSSSLWNHESTSNRYDHHNRGFSNPRVIGVSSDSMDFFFRQANAAREIPDPVVSNSTSQSESGNIKDISLGNHWVTKVEKKAYKPDEENARFKYKDKGKGIDLGGDTSVALESRDNSRFSRSDISKGTIQSEVCRRKVSNFIDPKKHSSYAGISDHDKGKGTELHRHLESNARLPHPRNSRKIRLVRNGCISPSNIEQGKTASKLNLPNKIPNGIPSSQVHITIPDSEGSHAHKKKEKMITSDCVVAKVQHDRDKSRLSRECSVRSKEVNVIADIDSDDDRSEDKGWRTTHNHRKKASLFSSCEAASVSTSSHPSNQRHETTMGNRTYMNAVEDHPEIISLRDGKNVIEVKESSELKSESRNVKGKRKFNLIHAHMEEGSSSTIHESDTSYLRTLRPPSNSRSVRSHRSQCDGVTRPPVIEVDERHCPEVVSMNTLEESCRVSDGAIARAVQVESDEMLARQLQEQFYNEIPDVRGSEEIDASIALSLLHEDKDLHASTARLYQSHHRNTSAPPVRPRFRHSSARTTTRSRGSTSNRIAQLRRNINRPMMDLDARLNYLVAMEATFGDDSARATPNHILRIQRDFNENDYEMLSALDDNNHQHGGASERQINNLPQSVIQNYTSEEACAVCLETPAIGDTVRHLPCLHKFHKECIDAWLRRKMSCPICKSGIT